MLERARQDPHPPPGAGRTSTDEARLQSAAAGAAEALAWGEPGRAALEGARVVEIGRQLEAADAATVTWFSTFGHEVRVLDLRGFDLGVQAMGNASKILRRVQRLVPNVEVLIVQPMLFADDEWGGEPGGKMLGALLWPRKADEKGRPVRDARGRHEMLTPKLTEIFVVPWTHPAWAPERHAEVVAWGVRTLVKTLKDYEVEPGTVHIRVASRAASMEGGRYRIAEGARGRAVRAWAEADRRRADAAWAALPANSARARFVPPARPAFETWAPGPRPAPPRRPPGLAPVEVADAWPPNFRNPEERAHARPLRLGSVIGGGGAGTVSGALERLRGGFEGLQARGPLRWSELRALFEPITVEVRDLLRGGEARSLHEVDLSWLPLRDDDVMHSGAFYATLMREATSLDRVIVAPFVAPWNGFKDYRHFVDRIVLDAPHITLIIRAPARSALARYDFEDDQRDAVRTLFAGLVRPPPLVFAFF